MTSTAAQPPAQVVVWALAFVYVTTDPFNNTSYTSTPPPNPDVIVWQLLEDDTRYAAIGKVDALPEPGVAATLAVDVAGLGGLSVRRREIPSS